MNDKIQQVEQSLKERFDSYESSFDHDAFDKFSKQLDSEERNNRYWFFYFWKSILFVTLFIGVSSTLLWQYCIDTSNNSDVNTTTILSDRSTHTNLETFYN